MNLHDFIDKVRKLKKSVESLLESRMNSQLNETLERLKEFLEILLNFFDDAQNVNALIDYDEKNEDSKEMYPFDIICKDVFAKLTQIEPKLDKCIPLTIAQNDINVNSSAQHNHEAYSELEQSLNVLLNKNLLTAINVLKCLNGHNKTLIILGANGSGKTSLANHLRDIETHIKVIPASKPIKVMGYINALYESTIDNYNNEIFQGGDLSEDLLQKLIIGLCSEHISAALKHYDGEAKNETTYVKIKKIFEDFFDVTLDDSIMEKKRIQVKKDDLASYAFNNMSDGERVAFFYIATIMVAPNKSFIVVDEPENHLNPAIYNKIWDRLIAERNDCQFIFISHTMEFINARSNFELIKIRNFSYPDKFDFEFLGNALEDLNSDFIVEVVGSRKPILFCEGSKTDHDYKVYESLFGKKYTIIPTGNCVSVENSVEACNRHAATYSIQSAIGIIDSDLKGENEINRLLTKHIYTLKCNEIEMLLLDEAIFKSVLAHIFKSENEFENFKFDFFKKLEDRK